MGRFSNAFGAPRTGSHAVRIGPGAGLAVVDLALTVAAAALLTIFYGVAPLHALGGLLLLGVVAHWVFDVPTTLNQTLGLA